MLRLTRLSLTDFRNYRAVMWQPRARVVVVSGANGGGKTNLLEAVSVLVPGRGVRGARLAELARRDGPGRWAVAGRFASGDATVDVGTGTPPEGGPERRVFRLNGVAPRSQAEVAAVAAMVWLTPQMDRLFTEAASGRRRFLDRLVWAVEPAHARDVAAHDAAMAGRNRLLAQDRQGQARADAAWLAGLEDAMARHAVAAAASRAALVARLNAALAAGAAGVFPPARMMLVDAVADRLEADPALAVEDWLRGALAASRARDAAAGSAQWGAHRADMALVDAQTGLNAAQSSTGQQKSLLIGVVLGHAALVAEARGTAPLLLLDEPAVHLDAARRAALFASVAALDAPVIMTGTDSATFHDLRGVAEGVLVRQGALAADTEFPLPEPAFPAADDGA